jgi:hypothetical protein
VFVLCALTFNIVNFFSDVFLVGLATGAAINGHR